jgi:hypothetical protein
LPFPDRMSITVGASNPLLGPVPRRLYAHCGI